MQERFYFGDEVLPLFETGSMSINSKLDVYLIKNKFDYYINSFISNIIFEHFCYLIIYNYHSIVTFNCYIFIYVNIRL